MPTPLSGKRTLSRPVAQRSYQAMVHKLIGIQTDRIDLTQVPRVSLHACSTFTESKLVVGCHTLHWKILLAGDIYSINSGPA